MAERSRLLNGTFRVTSTPGKGHHSATSGSAGGPAKLIRARVLLADDHSLVLEGIRKLLEKSVDLIGVVGDGRALVEAVQAKQVDVVLLDISMPLLNGIEAARQIRKISPNTKIIFLTMHDDRDYVMEALRLGASGLPFEMVCRNRVRAAIQTSLARWHIPYSRVAAGNDRAAFVLFKLNCHDNRSG